MTTAAAISQSTQTDQPITDSYTLPLGEDTAYVTVRVGEEEIDMDGLEVLLQGLYQQVVYGE